MELGWWGGRRLDHVVRLINTVARVLCGALYGGSPTRNPGQNFPFRRYVASHDRDRLEQQGVADRKLTGGQCP